jgi:hypothetical protein
MRGRAASKLREASFEVIHIAHLSAGAGEDIRVEFRLRRAVYIDTACEDTLRAGSAVWTATNRFVLNVGGAVRTCQARGWEVGIPPYVAADGVEVSPQHLTR